MDIVISTAKKTILTNKQLGAIAAGINNAVPIILSTIREIPGVKETVVTATVKSNVKGTDIGMGTFKSIDKQLPRDVFPDRSRDIKVVISKSESYIRLITETSDLKDFVVDNTDLSDLNLSTGTGKQFLSTQLRLLNTLIARLKKDSDYKTNEATQDAVKALSTLHSYVESDDFKAAVSVISTFTPFIRQEIPYGLYKLILAKS